MLLGKYIRSLLQGLNQMSRRSSKKANKATCDLKTGKGILVTEALGGRCQKAKGVRFAKLLGGYVQGGDKLEGGDSVSYYCSSSRRGHSSCPSATLSLGLSWD